VYGESGTGVSTVAARMAAQRGAGLLDDAERLERPTLEAWIEAHPGGVLGSHLSPPEVLAGAAYRCLPFRLQALQDDPASVPRCLAALAEEEGLSGALPPALGALPCPGNLRGLRNRLVRWKLLGQLPDDLDPDALPLATEDLAANLHVLERLLLHRALRRSYGNRVEAARRLGVSRRQLYLLIARHGDPVRGELPSSAGPKRLRKPARETS
jgi:transcriptional regulator with AAA-type ATPase domain